MVTRKTDRSPDQGQEKWRSVLQFLAGVAIMVGIGVAIRFISRQVKTDRLPAGWQIIRPPHEVSALALMGDTVWAGGRDGLYRLDRASGQLLSRPQDIPRLRYIRDLLVDDEGRLWIAHQGGVTIHTSDLWQPLAAEPLASLGAARALCQSHDGSMWIGTDNGAVRYMGEQTHHISTDDLGFSEVDVIFQDSKGDIWFGSSAPTRGGLTRYDGEEFIHYSSPDPLLHPSVNDIIETKGGEIWVATGFAGRGGAICLSQGSWSSLTEEEGLAGAKVRSLFEDEQSRLWFGSEYNGVAVRDEGEWRYLSVEDGLADVEVKEIVQDRDGVFWLGTADGINRIETLA